jgi:hypothetical protein
MISSRAGPSTTLDKATAATVVADAPVTTCSKSPAHPRANIRKTGWQNWAARAGKHFQVSHFQDSIGNQIEAIVEQDHTHAHSILLPDEAARGKNDQNNRRSNRSHADIPGVSCVPQPVEREVSKPDDGLRNRTIN